MVKKYKILELISTSLESVSVCEEYSYGQKTLYSYLYRALYDTKIDYDDRDLINNGFDSLDDAELFIENNIEEYGNWTIVCEYNK